MAWPGGLGAVRFTAPSGARIQKLRFYVWGVMDPVSVHILDHTWTPLLTRTVTPSPGESGDTCQVLAFGEDTQLSEKR